MTPFRLRRIKTLPVALGELRPHDLVGASDEELTTALGACLQLQRTLMAELRARHHQGELVHTKEQTACNRKDTTLLG